MNEHAMTGALRQAAGLWAAGGLALLLLVPACGGAAASGVAVGKVGSSLSAHAGEVPEGSAVCTAKEALAAPPGAPEKPTSEACLKAQKSDELWRRSMVVLAAYGDMLGTLAAGAGDESTGKLEAAQTGIRGTDWIDVEDGPEKAARTAVAQLVEQMGSNAFEGDAEKAVQGGAPHVKVVCDGLVPYLEAQASGLGDVRSEVEKKRTARTDRRCGALDTRTICVSESAADQMMYANATAHLAALERSHADARDAAAGFCAAHQKLEAAAAEGKFSSDETYAAVVDAVRSARRARETAAPAADKPAAPAADKPAAPAADKPADAPKK